MSRSTSSTTHGAYAHVACDTQASHSAIRVERGHEVLAHDRLHEVVGVPGLRGLRDLRHDAPPEQVTRIESGHADAPLAILGQRIGVLADQPGRRARHAAHRAVADDAAILAEEADRGDRQRQGERADVVGRTRHLQPRDRVERGEIGARRVIHPQRVLGHQETAPARLV
jgi:hypothetical protein